MRVLRRSFLARMSSGVGLLAAPPLAFGARAQEPFGFESVVALARERAGAEFQPPQQALPEALANLSYDRYRQVRFRAEHALWRGQGLPFEIQFFHPGFQFRDPVAMFEVENGVPRQLYYSPAQFDFGDEELAAVVPADLGFAGFRVHHPLRRIDYLDEFAVFLGASYFRIIGRDHAYGASARGLAVDTALPSGEEFPAFRAFWLHRPEPGALRLTVDALLDSPRVSGAYRFVLTPGEVCVVDVTAKVFPRARIERLGVAPLTSMFMYDEGTTNRFDDFRPEVHDSDGLLVHTGADEWIWRPLQNPDELQVSAFLDSNPRGFGLMQRDRSFANYQDLEAYYHQRPSVWVEPLDDWGKGAVYLVEIPSDEEVNDNIAAFWSWEGPVEGGWEVDLRYRLYATSSTPTREPLGRVVATRSDPGHGVGRRFIVDFDGGPLTDWPADQPLDAMVASSTGRISFVERYPNPEIRGWRVFFDFEPEGATSADLRCFLHSNGTVLSETWTYLWRPR